MEFKMISLSISSYRDEYGEGGGLVPSDYLREGTGLAGLQQSQTGREPGEHLLGQSQRTGPDIWPSWRHYLGITLFREESISEVRPLQGTSLTYLIWLLIPLVGAAVTLALVFTDNINNIWMGWVFPQSLIQPLHGYYWWKRRKDLRRALLEWNRWRCDDDISWWAPDCMQGRWSQSRCQSSVRGGQFYHRLQAVRGSCFLRPLQLLQTWGKPPALHGRSGPVGLDLEISDQNVSVEVVNIKLMLRIQNILTDLAVFLLNPSFPNTMYCVQSTLL